jgi:hypothetical protein
MYWFCVNFQRQGKEHIIWRTHSRFMYWFCVNLGNMLFNFASHATFTWFRV